MRDVTTTRPPGVRAVIAGLFVWLALGFALQRVFVATGGTQSNVFLFLILIAVGGAIYFALLAHRVLLRARLASAALTVANARPRLGETVRFVLALRARRAVALEKAVAVLTCAEEVRGARRREKPLPLVVARIERTVAEPLALAKGESAQLVGEIAVPRDGMQSFESHHALVRWQLDVLVYTGRHLAARRSEVLSVQPIRVTPAEDAT